MNIYYDYLALDANKMLIKPDIMLALTAERCDLLITF